MKSDSLNKLGIKDALKALEENRFTATDYLNDCTARIAAREPEIKAWAHLAIDEAAIHAGSRSKGRLRGVPMGIKDIIDTYDMPTGHDSPISKASNIRRCRVRGDVRAPVPSSWVRR